MVSMSPISAANFISAGHREDHAHRDDAGQDPPRQRFDDMLRLRVSNTALIGLRPPCERFPGEHCVGRVALTSVRQDDDETLAGHARSMRDRQRGVQGGTAGDPCRDTFLASELELSTNGLLFGDGNDLVDDVTIQNIGDEARSEPRQMVRTCGTAR